MLLKMIHKFTTGALIFNFIGTLVLALGLSPEFYPTTNKTLLTNEFFAWHVLTFKKGERLYHARKRNVVKDAVKM